MRSHGAGCVACMPTDSCSSPCIASESSPPSHVMTALLTRSSLVKPKGSFSL